MPRRPGSAMYTEKPAQVPMSEKDWEELDTILSLTGITIAALARYALRSMVKSRHYQNIKRDKKLMYSGYTTAGRARKKDPRPKYQARRLQIPLMPADSEFLEKIKTESGIGKAALVREAIHWFSHTNKRRIEQGKKMFKLPGMEEGKLMVS